MKVPRDADDLRLSILKLARRIRNERPRDDLTDARLSVLVALERDGDLTPGRLAELDHVTPPSMNRTVNALEETGWAVRIRSTDDARKVFVRITAAGKDVLRETRRLRSEWLRLRVGALSPDDRAALDAASEVLRRLADS
jgi:DNA-binding MarR family transcriptional regulator